MIESEETTQNISSTIFKPKQTFNETSYTEIYNNDKQNKKNNFINNYIDQDSSNLPMKTMLNKRSSTFSDVLSNKQTKIKRKHSVKFKNPFVDVVNIESYKIENQFQSYEAFRDDEEVTVKKCCPMKKCLIF